MIGLLFIAVFLLSFWQSSHRDKRNTYVPNPAGHWVNKGTEHNEQWEWWEPEINRKPLYVSVIEDECKFTIVVDDQPSSQGENDVECTDKREAEIAVSLFTAYYTVLGFVTVSDHMGLELKHDMNGGLK
jgi:hypothetical protein